MTRQRNRNSFAPGPADAARNPALSWGLLFVMGLALASCTSDKVRPQKVSSSDVAAVKKQDEAKGPAKPDAAKAPEPFVTHPTAKPPPPPKGALLLAPAGPLSGIDPVKDVFIYVQRCDEDSPCPKLLQTDAEIHCRDFGLGIRVHGWRLPSRHEAERFSDLDGLKEAAGYHWTRTPFTEDMMQVWIVDPSGAGPSTTIPRKRKPFTTRCVYEP